MYKEDIFQYTFLKITIHISCVTPRNLFSPSLKVKEAKHIKVNKENVEPHKQENLYLIRTLFIPKEERKEMNEGKKKKLYLTFTCTKRCKVHDLE